MPQHPKPEDGVDELDVALLDALHANPRASFERLGPAVGISPVTAARRWQRLADSGRAWVSSVPGPASALVVAVYEVRAEPGRLLETGRALAAIPQVGSVYFTDGVFDIHALAFAADMRTLTALLLERLPQVSGVAAAQAHIGLRWHSDVQWHLGAIDSSQQQSVVDDTGDSRRATRSLTFDPDDRALFLALQRDGRARYRDLARELATSEYLVKRRLGSLVRRGMMSFRTDFARAEGGWAAELVLWLCVPHRELRQVGDEIGQWPQTRICMSTIGAANLMVMSQGHQITALTEILDRVHRTFPAATVADQRLVLRPCKSWGRLLDTAGHATDVVPVDLWAPIAEPSG